MAVRLGPPPKFRAFDSNGDPLAGGKLYTYAAGTTTPLATYTDSTGDAANSNPVILDSDGYADVWFGNSSYKLIMKDANDVQIYAVDDYSVGNAIVANPTAEQTIEDFALNVTEGINGPIGQDNPNVGNFTSVDAQQILVNGTQIGFDDLAGTASASQLPELKFDLTFPIDGGGIVPSTGSKGYYGPFDFEFTIVSWALLSDQTGSASVDVKKGTYADFPGTAPTSITGSEKPSISAGRKNGASSLTGWTKTVSVGDILEFTLDSITSCTRLNLNLFCTRNYS